MVNKKYTFFLVMLLASGLASKAQSKLWDWNDKAVVSEKDESQFNDFASNKNPFPVKPRNAWELSLGGGLSFIKGDVGVKSGFGGSITLRKAINNIFSYRLGYLGAYSNGVGSKYDYSAFGGGNFVNYDYQNQTHSGIFDLIASVNTFSNYRGDPKANIYVLAGLNIISSKVKIKSPIDNQFHWLYNYMRNDLVVPNKGNKTAWLLGYSYGVGFAYKINSKFNIGIEERITQPFGNFDYLDGYRNTIIRTGRDTYYFTAIKLNYNLMK